MSRKFVNLDANESVFFERELEYVKTQTYDVKTPNMKAMEIIPISGEAGPAAESIVYHQYDMAGFAKIISNYADDLPRVDVKAQEFSTPVRSIGEAYGYNVQEIRASAAANKNLPTRKAQAARKIMDQTINKIAFMAYPTDKINGGLTGLIYNANVTKGTVTQRGGDYKFEDKTPDEIIADLNKACDDIISLTHGVEVPDTVLLPIKQYSQISTEYRSSTSDLTILEAFLKNRPYIKKVDWVPEFKDVTPVPSTGAAGPTDIMIAFRSMPDALTLEIPQPFEQFEVERRGLEYIIPCHSRCGGVIIYYPLSVNIVEGI